MFKKKGKPTSIRHEVEKDDVNEYSAQENALESIVKEQKERERHKGVSTGFTKKTTNDEGESEQDDEITTGFIDKTFTAKDGNNGLKIDRDLESFLQDRLGDLYDKKKEKDANDEEYEKKKYLYSIPAHLQVESTTPKTNSTTIVNAGFEMGIEEVSISLDQRLAKIEEIEKEKKRKQEEGDSPSYPQFNKNRNKYKKYCQ